MESTRKRTQVKDVERAVYDIRNADDYAVKSAGGLTREVVESISREKNEPEWMLDMRLESLDIYNKSSLPGWGPDLSELDLDRISMYVKPKAELSESWEDVPEDIKNTFERLGIPEAEKTSLAGVGAQYDSEVVYHSVKNELTAQGVIYTDFESAVRDYPDLLRRYFMKILPPTEHIFLALHGAVWSGGSFVYVPENTDVEIPIQSYFRANSPSAGQFEHTLIIVEKGSRIHFIEGCSAPKYNVTNLHAGAVELYVGEGSTLRYSTIENWSRNMMNLNSKRAIVEKDGAIEWVSGSFGSRVSMLYPMSVLQGRGARSEFTGITFAGAGQHLDTGTKVIHAAPETSSSIYSKSISKGGGAATYRSVVSIRKGADNCKSTISCESLMMDDISRADTVPVIDIRNDSSDLGHEAKIGKISDEAIFYLMTRGISEEEAKAMIVRGFVEPIAKELPLEYAVEMNNLINLELEGSIG